MSQLERIGVSLEKELLDCFDALIGKQGYQNRSEAIRYIIRRHLDTEKLSNPKAKAIAAVFIVYDHHAAKLLQKLMNLQHSYLLQTICSTHIHLDEHDCLELIVLKGRIAQINKLAENLLSQKGIKLGKVNFIAVD